MKSSKAPEEIWVVVSGDMTSVKYTQPLKISLGILLTRSIEHFEESCSPKRLSKKGELYYWGKKNSTIYNLKMICYYYSMFTCINDLFLIYITRNWAWF